MLVEIHMLKNYAPTNLNRDDSGSPKTCQFGEVPRGRISSQCLKRSWRTSPLLQKELAGHIGTRTRQMPELVAENLRSRGVAESYIAAAARKLSGFGNKNGAENKAGNFTSQVILYSQEDLVAIADAVQRKITESGTPEEFDKTTSKDLEDSLKNAAKRPVSLDIALFGRMVTSDAFADVEASMQVAHAISTNRTVMESDFFTAMDDRMIDNGEMGSAILDEMDYNSNCYYIYASLDTDQLACNLANTPDAERLIRKAIPALLRTIAYANPSGKQNSFAGHSLPSAVLVECRSYPVPISYANAFVAPARAQKDRDLVADSVAKLIQQVQQTDRDFALPLEGRYWFCAGDRQKLDGAEECESYEQLVQDVCSLLFK